jgi:hypothetical protein
MPQSVPAGLTGENVLRTLSELDAGLAHPFGTATGYELVHDHKRYAPKAVVELASRYSIGRMVLPEEFSGGEGWEDIELFADGGGDYVLARNRGQSPRDSVVMSSPPQRGKMR